MFKWSTGCPYWIEKKRLKETCYSLGEYRHERPRMAQISALVAEYKHQRFRGKEVLVNK